jgi:hypothetical protein
MPSFFQFTQGTESRTRFQGDSSPLLGRFRAVPPPPDLHRRRSSQLGLLSSFNGRGSVHVGYGAVIAAELDAEDTQDALIDDEDEDLSWWDRTTRKLVDLWVEPRQGAVKKLVDVWWSRYGVLVFMPAALVSYTASPAPRGSPSLWGSYATWCEGVK